MQLVLVLHFKIALNSSIYCILQVVLKVRSAYFSNGHLVRTQKISENLSLFSFPGEEQIDKNTSSNQ